MFTFNKEKIQKFFKNYFIDFLVFIPSLISILYQLFKTIYIQKISNFFILPTYYFEHLNFDYFMSVSIVFIIFLIFLNFTNMSSKISFPPFCFIFYFIISLYYLLGFITLIHNNILSYFSCFLIVLSLNLIFICLNKFFPMYILYSLGLFILFFIINFYSITFKKEYEIATLPKYQKVIIITMQNSDYLVAPYTEKNNILYIHTNKRRWVNRLDILNIKSHTFNKIKISLINN